MDAYDTLHGLNLVAQKIASSRRDQMYLTDNSGESEYVNGVFAMRSYCWCDSDLPGHEDECPPNFEHFASGLKIRWYKHAGRCPEISRPIGESDWLGIILECLESI